MLFLPLSFLAFLLLLPLLFFVGFFRFISIGFENLGIAPEAVVVILLVMLVGSKINIPLGKRRFLEVEERSFFGLRKRRGMKAQGLSLNVGGGLVPLLIALYLLLFTVPVAATLLASLLMVLVCWRVSRVVPGRGVVIPLFFPPLAAVLFSYLLVPQAVPQAAFIAGVLGVLLGADLLRLPFVLRRESGILSIGGAGVFDGIFLTAMVAALLTAL